MDNFKKALDEAIKSWVNLSEQWEKIEAEKSDELSEKYPFQKDFREVLHDLMEWKEHLNK
ncbi:hypothetical protein [Paenibacillus sp. FSL W8-1287]|uniref:hypothetical protein n=1 Tax=Paenibacillus sp. FSL W8-1287 TaxID=2954653 RepID=UPI0030CF943B